MTTILRQLASSTTEPAEWMAGTCFVAPSRWDSEPHKTEGSQDADPSHPAVPIRSHAELSPELKRCVQLLEDDFYRQAEYLSIDDVARVISRRNLPSIDADGVWKQLHELGISVKGPVISNGRSLAAGAFV